MELMKPCLAAPREPSRCLAMIRCYRRAAAAAQVVAARPWGGWQGLACPARNVVRGDNSPPPSLHTSWGTTFHSFAL